MGLIARDKELIQRCLQHDPGAWNDFAERFLGLVYHIIQHTADLRSYPLTPEDKEDIAAQIMLTIVENDYAPLRRFRGNCSLAAYLTVIARRSCGHEMAQRSRQRESQGMTALANEKITLPEPDGQTKPGLDTLEEVAKLLRKLPSRERAVVRLFYIEGRTYEEISTELNIPVNSIGAILSRARKKLKGEA